MGKKKIKSPTCLKHMREAHFTGREASPVKDTFPSLLEEVGAEGDLGHYIGASAGNAPVTFSWATTPAWETLRWSFQAQAIHLCWLRVSKTIPESRGCTWELSQAWGLFPQLLPSSHCSFLWAQAWFLLFSWQFKFAIIGCSNPMLKPHPTLPLKFSPDEGRHWGYF